MALLELSGVTMTYPSAGGRLTALAAVDLSIEEGELVSVVGPSGCGKTTLLHLIAGFIHPTTGSIRLSGALVREPDADRGVVFQQPALLPWMNVEDNVGFGLMLKKLPASKREPVVDHYLDLTGLTGFGSARTYELSAGMQQRAAIARALANDPRILLMDEPFAALDAFTRDAMQENLLRIWRATGKTVIFITHSVEEAVFLGTRVLVLSSRPGRLIWDVRPPFSRATEAREGYHVRASAEFGEFREQILEKIYRTSQESIDSAAAGSA